MSHAAPARTATVPDRSWNLVSLWFSYAGRITSWDFLLKGFAPGILLGSFVLRADAATDARGLVVYPYLLFSLWPLSALLTKLWRNSRAAR
jgi:hypothetical protein